MALETCLVVVGLGAAGAAGVSCTAQQLRSDATPTKESDILAMGHKYVTLPDGRKLEYSVSGKADGVPVYYQHGYGNSCYVAPCMDQLLKEMGIKMIAASMPGFGLSDSYPLGRTRKLAEWPADVQAVLDAEGITCRCHIYGVSAGCVHAAALAHGLPEERVGNVIFCTPTAPDHAPGVQDGISMQTRLIKCILARPCYNDFLAYAMWNIDSVKRAKSSTPDVYAAIIRGRTELPEETAGLIRGMDHSMVHTYRGIPDNFPTIEEDLPWLPELGQLTARGHAMAVTTTSDDTTNPPPMQHWFQQSIAGCGMMEVAPGWGHAHFMLPWVQRRMFGFLLTGRDPGVPKPQPSAGGHHGPSRIGDTTTKA